MIARLQSLARRGVLRALRRWGNRQTRRHARRYAGPVSVGRTSSYLGRTARVDYDPPHGRGWHGQGVIVGSRASEDSLVYQEVDLDTDGGPVTLSLPLTVTVEVLP